MRRICCKCKIEKDISEFTKDKNDKTGFTYSCKKCRLNIFKQWKLNNPEKYKETIQKRKYKQKEYYSLPEIKLKYRKKFIERKFNISYSDYEKMQIKQNNKCAICGNEENSADKDYLSVDHNHESGDIRGLLCTRCNVGLGYFKDNIQNLKNAINYLENENNVFISL